MKCHAVSVGVGVGVGVGVVVVDVTRTKPHCCFNALWSEPNLINRTKITRILELKFLNKVNFDFFWTKFPTHDNSQFLCKFWILWLKASLRTAVYLPSSGPHVTRWPHVFTWSSVWFTGQFMQHVVGFIGFGYFLQWNENIFWMLYRAFHRFGQAKIAYGGLVLSSSQFLILPRLPLKMMLPSKVVKIDSKIIILLP